MRFLWILGVIALAFAVAVSVPSPAAAQLTGSEHDFTVATGAAPFNEAPYSNMCVTCHSPHHTSSPALLWNHELSANTLTFGSGAATYAGTDLPTDVGAWVGPSKFCLSCHDGSVAVGSMIAPVPNGSSWGGGEKVTGDHLIAPNGSLAGNHPIALPYPYVPNAVYNGITSKADPTSYVTSPVDVKIYEFTATQKGIECGSCHEVHNKNTHGPFLRSGYGCQSCHNL